MSEKNDSTPFVDLDTHGMQSEYQKRFERGEKINAIWAIELAGIVDDAVPTWAMAHLLEAIDGWKKARFRSFDEALGIERPARFKKDVEEKKRKYMLPVYFHITRRRQNNEACDDLLFESVGEAYGLKKTATKLLYRAALKELGISTEHKAKIM